MHYNYIVDSHCHLDLLEEKGANINDIINSAKKNNVELLQTICTKIPEIEKILKYTSEYDFIYASLGNHPCYIKNDDIINNQEIIKLVEKHPKIIGIGETGLDYYHDRSYIKEQKQSFLQHILASQQSQLPTIIHNRDSDDDMSDILQSEQKNKRFPALIHCFSSDKSLAKTALDLGIYISISGIVTFKNAHKLHDVVKFVPLEFLLVETDSPYLAPTPFRGQTNQPAFTKYVVDHIAELKNVSRETVIKNTTANFHKIFKRASMLGNNDLPTPANDN